MNFYTVLAIVVICITIYSMWKSLFIDPIVINKTQGNKNGHPTWPPYRPTNPLHPEKVTIGTRVRLPPHPVPEAQRETKNMGWERAMNPYLNKVGEVRVIDHQDHSVKLSVDGGKYWYAIEWLEVIDSPKE